MWTLRTVVALAAFALSSSACAPQKSGLEAVADAMGATTLNSIEYSGSGLLFGFGQAYLPGEPWPRFFQRSYAVSVNYQTPAMRLETVRSQAEVPPHGGAAQPVAGEQRTILLVSAQDAWTQAGDQATPNPGTAPDRLRQLWATPHGVVKAALANGGTLEGNTISVMVEGRAVTATLNDQMLVERVQYLSTNEVVGDYPVEIAYSDYADHGGVKFPAHIMQTEDGHPTLDLVVTDVRPNATVAIDVPANVPGAPEPPAVPPVQVTKLGDGAWYFTAAGGHNWAVEFRDHVVVVEGFGSEARSLAVIQEIGKTIPGKPIRYVINTHSHYDHSGGLRPYVALGATVVTHELNKAFFEAAWARPRTIKPDTLSKAPKPPVFDTVGDMKVMTDGTQRLELYHMTKTGHHGANLIVYLPKGGVVYWGDGYNPPPGDDPRDPSRTPEYGIDLYRTIEQRKLAVRTIAPAHGAGVRPYDSLKRAIGLIP